jgi:hypothetical protein
MKTGLLEKYSVVPEPEAPEIRIDCHVGDFFIARFHQFGQHIRWNDAMNWVEVVFTHDV